MFTKSEMHITLPTVIMAVLVVLAAAVFAAGADTLTGGARFATVNADAIYLDGELVATTQHVAEAVAALAVHTNLTDNPHGVTAPQIGALTNEQDLAALRAYHYGSPDIVESPAGWFVFDGSGAITGFNWEAGRENVVIPWAIGGVPVTTIGANAFDEVGSFQMSGIVSVIAPQTVTTVGNSAFGYCEWLVSVSLPQAQTVGDFAFDSCTSLASVSLPQAQTVGTAVFTYCEWLVSVSLPQAQTVGDFAFCTCTSLTAVYFDGNAPAEAEGVFYGITPPPTVYVTDPQATGWGDTWNGAPVVRPPLYADAIYQAGELVATTGHVAQEIASQLPGIIYSNSVSQIVVWTNSFGACTNLARLEGGTWITNAFGALTAEADLAALRTYHYGSPDIVESPAGWFGFDGAGTVTSFNWEVGRENVVIPWAIGGVPVTTIEGVAFQSSGIVSVIAPQTLTAIGAYAFNDCSSLTSVSSTQATSIGNNAFAYCVSLTSVSLPQAQTIGAYTFNACWSLTSVSLPQAQTIGAYTFVYCLSLASVHMGQNAPAEAAGVFTDITPPPTVYVTDPQATGWGDTWNGATVVRPPLYGSNVTAQAYTLNGDTITEWPSSGATNITDGVTSGTYSEATRTIDISNLLAGVSVELPDGIVTNGMAGPLTISNVGFASNGSIWSLAGIYGYTVGGGYITIGTSVVLDDAADELRVLDYATGQIPIAISVGKIKTGPIISGKQAHIFTDGTNTFQVDVNDLTNQFATVADATGIIAPLIASGTNITVTSTQSVYSVAVTGAGPVGIDWSGLGLDGTGRAEVTLRLNVTDWGGTNVTFAPSLTFDATPEILVTGVWEFAASTVDGVTTRIRQTWPECCGWSKLDSVYGVPANVGTMYDFAAAQTNFITLSFMRETKMLIRYTIHVYSVGTTRVSVWMAYAQAGNTAFSEADIVSSRVLTPTIGYYTMMDVAETKYASQRCVKLWLYPQGYAMRMYGGTFNYRPLNANERAAYAAGWRP